MQRVLTVGLALVCVCLLFSSGSSAQLRVVGDGGSGGSAPVPVAVNNFPTVQTIQGNVAVDKTVTVTGSVAVTNLPAVQQVTGTVSVSNLPVDATGRVLVAAQPTGGVPLTVRSTSATYQGNLGGRTGATQKCRAEFPQSHFAGMDEINTVHATRGIIWLSSDTQQSWADYLQDSNTCDSYRSTQSGIVGTTVNPTGIAFGNCPCDQLLPILCAE
jgi:hypothetical protein